MQNKQIQFTTVLGIAISVTVFLGWAWLWKGWVQEDAFWTMIGILWPTIVFGYLGGAKAGAVAIFMEFKGLLSDWLHKRMTEADLVPRVVQLIKNAVTFVNEVLDKNEIKGLDTTVTNATDKKPPA